MSAKAFALPAPWAHLDPKTERTGFGRKNLSPDQVTEIEAGGPVYLAIPGDGTVRVSGRRMGTQSLGEKYEIGNSDYRIHLLSVGVNPSEEILEVEVEGSLVGTIRFNGHIPRPAFSAGDENADAPTRKAEQLDIFLLSVVDLIQMANDPQYNDKQIVWERLLAAWTDHTAESSIPPMALIVRHAQTLQKLTKDLYENPRHILRRLQELTPVDRVQQLDISCVRWLSRQPGKDVYERAGPRQRILSVQRHQSIDTLENRVLVDFSKRSQLAASNYTKRYDRLKKTGRWGLVNMYGRKSHRINRDLSSEGVSRIHPPLTPNFVLLQDVRYRRLWKSYLELLRQSDDEDECWRWQHRLWSDYIRLLTHISLRADDRFQMVAETPLRINEEQERGSWVAMSSQQSGTWLVQTKDGMEYIVSLIWSMNSEHQKSQVWMQALGCQGFFHIQSLSDSREAYVALWAYHSYSDTRPDLKSLGESAKIAIENCKHNAQLVDDVEVDLSGIIIVSDFEEVPDLKVYRTENGEATALKTGITLSSRESIFRMLQNSLINKIETMFASSVE
jgi:hypothetical protein